MLWLRHGMLRSNADTVVTFDDGDGIVQELHSRHGELLETEVIPLHLGPRSVQLTIRATRQRSLVPGAGTYLWDYSLVYTDEGAGEIAMGRPGGSSGGDANEDDSWWPELNERVNLQSTREAPKYVDQSGLRQGDETAVEYEVRVRVGGKLGGIRARAEDLSVDGPAFMSNDSFLTDRGANLSVWRRYSDFHNLRMDLLSCFVGASAAVLKGVPVRTHRSFLHLIATAARASMPSHLTHKQEFAAACNTPCFLRLEQLALGAHARGVHAFAGNATKDMAADFQLCSCFYRSAPSKARGFSSKGSNKPDGRRETKSLRAPVSRPRTTSARSFCQRRHVGTAGGRS